MQFFPFPDKFRELEKYEGRFEAHKLKGATVDTYFAGYPAGTVIEAHSHDTENHGYITAGALFLTINGKECKYAAGEWYHVARGVTHAARFEEDTSEIEFWFK